MSDYDACYCDDLERPSISKETLVQNARIERECTECRHAILPGESYHELWGIWPGIQHEPMVHASCARCMVLREYVRAHIPCFCDPLGDLLENVGEIRDQYPEIRADLDALLADIEAQPSLSRTYY